MKNQIKSIGLSVIVFMINGVLNNVSAHDISNALGTSASATDWFTVACPTSTAEFYVEILDTSAADGVFFKVLISKNGALASTDKPESGAHSPSIILAKGSGVYNIFVTHTGATTAFKTYTVYYGCLNVNHIAMATIGTLVVRQDQ